MIASASLGSTTLILVSGLNKDLGISDHVFMVADSVVLTVLGQVRLLLVRLDFFPSNTLY